MSLTASILSAVTLPALHLNGTSADDLLEQQADVLAALEGLRQALAKATPNARDYYVVSETAYAEALAAHRAEFSVLEALVSRHEVIGLHLAGG